MSTEQVVAERHPIQLIELNLLKCSVEQIAVDYDPTEEATDATNEDVILERATIGHIDEGQPVQVLLRVQVGTKIEAPVFKIDASLVGTFTFAVDPFDKERVSQWARTNAYLLLLPFMREILFSATKFMPSGPYLVPLITLPTSTVSQQTS